MTETIGWEIWGAPLWLVALFLVVALVEAPGLTALPLVQPEDDSPRARGRAMGVKFGIAARFILHAGLALLLCAGRAWAGIPLAVSLIYTGLRPARDFAEGFASGFGESGEEPPPWLVALSAAAYLAFGRGILAFIAVLAFFELRGAAA